MKNAIPSLVIAGLVAGVTAAAEPPTARSQSDPDGAYVIKLERPFGTRTVPTWLPLRIAVALKDGKPASAVAFAHQFNSAWHTVDISRLVCNGDRCSGAVGVSLRWDDVQRSVESASVDDRMRRQYTPAWKDGTVQPFAARVAVRSSGRRQAGRGGAP